MLNLSRRLFSARNGARRGGGGNGAKVRMLHLSLADKHPTPTFLDKHSLTISQLMHTVKIPSVRKVQMPEPCSRVPVITNVMWKKITSF